MDINTIESNVEELKRITAAVDNIISAIDIDWRQIQQTAPQILKNTNLQNTPDVKTACEFLVKRCVSIEEGIKELKARIPLVDK